MSSKSPIVLGAAPRQIDRDRLADAPAVDAVLEALRSELLADPGERCVARPAEHLRQVTAAERCRRSSGSGRRLGRHVLAFGLPERCRAITIPKSKAAPVVSTLNVEPGM